MNGFLIMSSVSLVFPHQLFEDHPALAERRPVWLIEDELFFSQYPFHKQKLILHRASMAAYRDELKGRGFRVEIKDIKSFPNLRSIFDELERAGVKEIHVADVVDYLLDRRLRRWAPQYGMKIHEYSSPNFLCTREELHEFFHSRKRYFLTDFYVDQRKKRNIMITAGTPWGDKWTFDTENRKKMPAGTPVPSIPSYQKDPFVSAAKKSVAKDFPSSPGGDQFHYPVTRQQAKDNFRDFLKHRFINYGPYQDAIVRGHSALFHSLLTPSLNIGLLDPAWILDEAIKFAVKNNVPTNSLEGFVRQILGWREFIRAVYVREGVKERTMNHWSHNAEIPIEFYEARTGIPPVDDAIAKVLDSSYSNHIERLMVLGNFMLLCGFHPDAIYRWFMELYIDAYDWVMVPNVYGMSQFADGGLMATKPYISGSNYILKMSDFKKGPWCDIWDGLYWGFIERHQTEFARNPRMSMMTTQLRKMPAERRRLLTQARDRWLSDMGIARKG